MITTIIRSENIDNTYKEILQYFLDNGIICDTNAKLKEFTCRNIRLKIIGISDHHAIMEEEIWMWKN